MGQSKRKLTVTAEVDVWGPEAEGVPRGRLLGLVEVEEGAGFVGDGAADVQPERAVEGGRKQLGVREGGCALGAGRQRGGWIAQAVQRLGIGLAGVDAKGRKVAGAVALQAGHLLREVEQGDEVGHPRRAVGSEVLQYGLAMGCVRQPVTL